MSAFESVSVLPCGSVPVDCLSGCHGDSTLVMLVRMDMRLHQLLLNNVFLFLSALYIAVLVFSLPAFVKTIRIVSKLFGTFSDGSVGSPLLKPSSPFELEAGSSAWSHQASHPRLHWWFFSALPVFPVCCCFVVFSMRCLGRSDSVSLLSVACT